MSRLAAILPISDWLPKYERANLRLDVIAGLTVAALVIPKNLGYAGIAQLPLEYGLYAAAAGAIIYAVFGTCRQISTGPSSSLAAVAASAIAVAGVAAGTDTAEFVAAITIATGVCFLVLAVFRMGWISQFLSRAVVTGFLFGAAIDVVVGELGKITGSEASGDNSISEFVDWVRHLDQRHTLTVVVGLVALGVVLGLRRWMPKAPGALVLLVGGLLASVLFDLADHGVSTVGDVPRGFPSVVVPSGDLVSDHLGTIVAAAVAITLIGYSQTTGYARVFANRHQYRIDVNQESVAQGMSNLGAGFLQGMPVSTSLSASSLNDNAGARTPVASIVTGLTLVFTLFVLAPVFSHLPKPVLAVVIIDAVVFGMMDVPEMRRMYRVKRFDFWVAVAAVVAVLVSGVLTGVLIGMLLSILWLVYVSTHPATPELGHRAGSTAYRSLDVDDQGITYPGLLVLRFDGGLFFATADALEDRIRQIALDADPPLTGVVVDFGGVNFVDSQGSDKIGQMVTTGERVGIGLRLARVKPEVMSVLEADGVVARLGAERFHANLHEAVAAELAARGTTSN